MTEFVFRKTEGGLEFIGDFDALYSADQDPWGQSGTERTEYSWSRSRQLEILARHRKQGSLLDVGCGLGVTTNQFAQQYAASGMDISAVAVERARQKYPELPFHVGNICASSFSHDKRYEVIVMNQLMWYVIDRFEQALLNLTSIAADDAIILITNFLFSEHQQQYAREYFKGHTDVMRWLASLVQKQGFTVLDYECVRFNSVYYDFHCLIQKR